MRRFWALAVALMTVSAGMVAVGVSASPAGATTYSVTSTSMCGGAGTFQQALADANAHSGTDTIEFTPGLTVDASTCNTLPAPIFVYPLSATQSVDIVGNGATIVGGQVFVNSAGRVNDPNQCPSRTAGTTVVTPSVGFLEVGTFDVDNSAISVTAHDLSFSGMPSLFLVEKHASLSLTDATADKTQSFNFDCTRPPIQSTEGNVTLTRVLFTDSSTPALHANDPNSTTAVVAGFGAGALVMDHVTMSYNFSGRAVIWHGASAEIVGSLFYESGGFQLDATHSDVVNTAWHTHRQQAVDRIITTAGTARIEASTFFWSWPVCQDCTSPSLGFATAGTGVFDFHSTAIGSGAIFPGAEPLLWGNTSTGFTSDALTWVQPTGSQDATAIQAILPNALTDPPGLGTAILGDAISDVTPLLGTVVTPGVLIDAVADASCDPPNNANKLVNPIDSTCITTDVFGKPRWDSGNDTRNIGAVQSVQSPHLTVVSADTDVVLSWNRPVDPVSGPITGYRVTYVPAAGGTPQTLDVSGADTTGATITGLTAGVPYLFDVRALTDVGAGPASNEVTATPLGPVGSPEVSAVPGEDFVQLFWTEPDAGGHPGPLSYFVVYRIGISEWVVGPGPLSARTTRIPDLTCYGYEFGVIAVSTDGTASLVAGTTTAVPTKPCPLPPFPPVPPVPPVPGLARIFGVDAVGTSIAVAQAEFPGGTGASASAVVLARSDFFSDALAGGPLAAEVNGPLLVTPGTPVGNRLDPRVRSEIQRLAPAGSTVYVLGGPLALSPDIDRTLTDLGYVVVRVAGPNEFSTAVAIADRIGAPNAILEATGLDFPDALSAVPAAIAIDGVILLTDGDEQAPETQAYIDDHPAVPRFAIGGPLAAAGADPAATAVYGDDLYGTSAAVASTWFATAGVYGVATSATFPDALSGGVFMATGGRMGPMLLVGPAVPVPAPITSYLHTLGSGTPGYAFGGPLAISDAVLAAVRAAVG